MLKLYLSILHIPILNFLSHYIECKHEREICEKGVWLDGKLYIERDPCCSEEMICSNKNTNGPAYIKECIPKFLG